MRLLSGALLITLLAVCTACSGRPGTRPAGVDMAAEGLKAFDRGDWVTAARMLREAVVHDPKRLKLHYALAIADTHLDLREEAIQEFQWVLANAPAGSVELLTARQWLTDMGVLGTRVSSLPPAPEASNTSPDGPREGSVSGQVSWMEANAPVQTSRLQLFLKGTPGSKTQDEYFVVRTDADGHFEFKSVPPGRYKLVDRIAGTPIWRMRVDVEPGQRVALDLTPDNSTRAHDDFPGDK